MAATATYVSANEALIHVSISGVTFPASIYANPSRPTFATFEGGDPDADQDILLPGNVQPGIARPGPVKRSPVTVEIPISVALQNLRPTIDAACNHGMTASYTLTDADGNPISNTETRTGLFKGAKWPKWDPTTGKTPPVSFTMTCNT